MDGVACLVPQAKIEEWMNSVLLVLEVGELSLLAFTPRRNFLIVSEAWSHQALVHVNIRISTSSFPSPQLHKGNLPLRAPYFTRTVP